MEDSAKNRLAAATRHLLKPLMKILLRNGISYQEFAEWARLAAVESCQEQLLRDGKRATDSQVAILTGLTRKEVKRLREFLTSDDDVQNTSSSKANRATRVLTGWHRDPDFCDASGLPKALSANDAEQGFPALVKRYSGDMPVRAMLEELLRVGAIQEVGGDIKPLARSYLPESGDPQGIRLLGTAVHDLTSTISHNLDANRDTPNRFQRASVNSRVSERSLPILRRMVSEHGMKLLEMIDDWMADHETEEAADNAPTSRRAGIGIFYFEEETSLPAEDSLAKDSSNTGDKK